MPFDGTNVSKTAQLLINARTYLVEHGIVYGRFGFDGGPRCSIGAIHSVTPGVYFLRGFRQENRQARRLLRRAVGTKDIGYWHDSQREWIDKDYVVIRGFDRAIELALAEK